MNNTLRVGYTRVEHLHQQFLLDLIIPRWLTREGDLSVRIDELALRGQEDKRHFLRLEAVHVIRQGTLWMKSNTKKKRIIRHKVNTSPSGLFLWSTPQLSSFLFSDSNDINCRFVPSLKFQVGILADEMAPGKVLSFGRTCYYNQLLLTSALFELGRSLTFINAFRLPPSNPYSVEWTGLKVQQFFFNFKTKVLCVPIDTRKSFNWSWWWCPKAGEKF